MRVYASFAIGLSVGFLTQHELTMALGGALAATAEHPDTPHDPLVGPDVDPGSAPTPNPPTAGTTAGTAATTTAPAPSSFASVSPSATPTPTPTLSCPGKMLLIPAIDGMRLAQPVGGREDWPRPRSRAIAPRSVDAFCIDPTPLRRTDYASSPAAVRASAQCAWNTAANDGSAWTYCLIREEAERACAATVPGGQLPSLVQWESAVRAKPKEITWPKHEWSGERFPTAELNRVDTAWSKGDAMWVGLLKRPANPETATLMLSWSYQDPEMRHPERTFRCAAPAVGG